MVVLVNKGIFMDIMEVLKERERVCDHLDLK